MATVSYCCFALSDTMNTPTESQKRLNLFGLSGGKDSTRLWAWAFNESGYPVDSIIGTFWDTENEYQEVYDQISALDAYGQLRGARPIFIGRTIGFLSLCIKKKRFPGARARFCTEELKIKPAKAFVENLKSEGFEVVSHSGVRKSESTERSLLEEWGESGVLGCKERRPLLDMTIEEVWGGCQRYGLPINPLYFTGRKRVGCQLCCMSNKQDVRITAKTRPQVIEKYRDWEMQVGEARSKSNRNGSFGAASFFPATHIPSSQRNGEFFSGKKQTTFRVATIDDVVRWSFTLRGGVQGGFDFMFDDSPIFEIDDAHAPCKSGYCE